VSFRIISKIKFFRIKFGKKKKQKMNLFQILFFIENVLFVHYMNAFPILIKNNFELEKNPMHGS
jgi:hypothetical protein